MKKTFIFLIVCLILPITCVYASEHVVIGGDSIGIEGEYDGVYVSGTYQYKINDETIHPEDTVHTKDLIIAINKQDIHSLNDFSTYVSEYNEIKNEIPITVIRDHKKVQTTLISTKQNGKSTYGLYLKEKVLGIGTLTFYNPQTSIYGALGHPITNDDQEYMQSGNLYDASITAISKATEEKSGEKNGQIEYNEQIGDIQKNNDFGIYGQYIGDKIEKKTILSADAEDLKLGEATFYTVLEGKEIEAFSINITDINKQSLDGEKAFTFEVIDHKLIEKSGGIVHGMSGSPIVQNDKLIGAITHVSSDDPLIGYGLFIDVMLKESKIK